MKNVENLKPKEKGMITNLNLQLKIKNRLEELGIIENTQVELIKFAPLGDPIEISLRGYNIALRKKVAKNISVDEISTEWRKQ